MKPDLAIQPMRNLFAEVAGVEYEVTIRPSQNCDGFYVVLNESVAGSSYGKFIASETICDCGSDFEAVREFFQTVRGKMRTNLRFWSDFKSYAREETGGKRGYYTRLANRNLRTALKYAEQWKLCKAIWKQLTKL